MDLKLGHFSYTCAATLSLGRRPFVTIAWLWRARSATDRTADEGRDQIELFVIAAYPNSGMPAIILPRLGMAGGKWDSSPCSVILLDPPSPPPLPPPPHHHLLSFL